MSHYEDRLASDTDALLRGVGKVGRWVQENVSDAVTAIVNFDRGLANRTILRDRAVNGEIDELDHLCHLFVVKHLPSAKHLRLVSATLRVSVALERVGDYAVLACRELLQLSEPLPEGLAADVKTLGDLSVSSLRTAVEAFVTGDPERAALGEGMARQVDPAYLRAYKDLTKAGDRDERQTRDLFSALLTARVIKRVADQAENICEQTQFHVTGEGKGSKTFRILFMDERGDLLAPLARAFAEEAYPDAGRFRSAGYAPASQYSPALTAFMQSRGIGLDEAPTPLAKALDVPKHYHVIVGIGCKVSEHVMDIPFRTAALRWDLTDVLEAAAGAEGAERTSILYRGIADEVTGLMDTLGLESER